MIASRNGDSVTGAAYDAELMVLKAMDKNGSGTSQNVAKAIYYAVDHGADVINLSMNSSVDQPLIKTALDYAKAHDVLTAISSGNSLANTPNCPANYAMTNSNVCSVGATFDMNGSEVFNAVSSKAGTISSYNYVDAGGTNITGYDQSGKVVTMAGTSMAAPLVASEMAVIKQALESVNLYSMNQIDDMTMSIINNNTHNVQLVGIQPFTPIA
jgi:subtilisin family serine protease